MALLISLQIFVFAMTADALSSGIHQFKGKALGESAATLAGLEAISGGRHGKGRSLETNAGDDCKEFFIDDCNMTEEQFSNMSVRVAFDRCCIIAGHSAVMCDSLATEILADSRITPAECLELNELKQMHIPSTDCREFFIDDCRFTEEQFSTIPVRSALDSCCISAGHSGSVCDGLAEEILADDNVITSAECDQLKHLRTVQRMVDDEEKEALFGRRLSSGSQAGGAAARRKQVEGVMIKAMADRSSGSGGVDMDSTLKRKSCVDNCRDMYADGGLHCYCSKEYDQCSCEKGEGWGVCTGDCR